jgi:hypothetical protein
MQNIADVFVEKKMPQKTLVTYNHRHKTISTAKKAYVSGGPIQETPEECFYVQLQSARELLDRCQFILPPKRTLADYLERGPDALFVYHPALGPFYSLIAQKMVKGRLALGSELQLDLADALIENLDLDGSLLVQASQPLGHFEEGILHFSNHTGRCILRNVSVKNRGVDWSQSKPYWKNRFVRLGSLQIRLNGFSEFIAEDVLFEGNFEFEVPEGVRMRVQQREGKIVILEERLQPPKPFWNYQWDPRRGVIASR